MDEGDDAPPRRASRVGSDKPHKLLACTNCRSRKLKCSREHPCNNCTRSDADCVFPERKRIQKPRKTKNSELLQRLSRLESIVGKVGLENLEAGLATSTSPETHSLDSPVVPVLNAAQSAESASAPETPPSATTSPSQATGSSSGATKSAAKDLRRKDRRQQSSPLYMSSAFWSNLSNEVEGLKNALAQSTDTDDGDEEDEEDEMNKLAWSKPGRKMFALLVSTTTLLLGHTPVHQIGHLEHPTRDQIRYLTAVYFENVDIVLKILHRPTITAALHKFADTPDHERSLSPDREVLFFTMYYAAVCTLDAATCEANLGIDRDALIQVLQNNVQLSLGKADFLNTNCIETLQGFTLFCAVIRSHEGNRAPWALLGLVLRLAQAYNLHREDQNIRFTPYEAELRRRLWWQILVLDVRSAEDRGTETMIATSLYDTRLPHNVNDDDFGPDTTEDLVDREGPTDVTFCLCSAQSSGIFLYVGFPRLGSYKPADTDDTTIKHAQFLEKQFVANADPNHVPSHLASLVVRLIILKLWLLTQFPLHPISVYPRAQPTGAAGPSKLSTAAQAADKMPNASNTPGVSQPYPFPPGTPFAPHPAESGGRSQAGTTGPPKQPASSIRPGRGAGPVSREAILRTAITIIELRELTSKGPYAHRFSWWSDTYVQWHPLAVALAELCTQTTGPLVERAWRAVDAVYSQWAEIIADTKRGTLWRPIRKLYRKAKAARAAAVGDIGMKQLSPTMKSESTSPPVNNKTNPGGSAVMMANAMFDFNSVPNDAVDRQRQQSDGFTRGYSNLSIQQQQQQPQQPSIEPSLGPSTTVPGSTPAPFPFFYTSEGMGQMNMSGGADVMNLDNETNKPSTNNSSSNFPNTMGGLTAAEQAGGMGNDSQYFFSDLAMNWNDINFDMVGGFNSNPHQQQQSPNQQQQQATGLDNAMLFCPDWSVWSEFVSDAYAAEQKPRSTPSTSSQA